MYYIGLDVHLRTTSMCILDHNGKIVLEKTIRGNIITILSAFDKIPGEFCVCYETSNGYGTLYDHLSKVASRVVVAHPGQVRLIFRSKRKTDCIDSQKLAKLLFLGEVPPVYVPDVNIRDWRHLITMRHWSVKRQSSCKNRLRSLLRHHAFETPKNLWGRQGMQWLSSLTWPTEEMALECDLLCEELEQFKTRIKRIETRLNAIAKNHPGVFLLRSTPGIGIRTAEALVAWIDHPKRFKKAQSIGSYFGMVPSEYSSAGRQYSGHITKQEPALVRKLLIEATWQSIRRSEEIRSYFQRIQQNDP